MPTKQPSPSDFPPSLTFTLTPPQQPPQRRPPPNILLLLHGLGDTLPPYTALAKALNLPETTVLAIQAPHALPFDLPGFHWGDDITFDARSGALDMDSGFARATGFLVRDVIGAILVGKCGYALRDVLIWGLGQGGMVALEVARAVGNAGPSPSPSPSPRELGGVISIGAPVSGSRESVLEKQTKTKTPVLLVSGRDSARLADSAVRRTMDFFEFVEVHAYARKGDVMPRNRDEMTPIMRFLASRLRSWQGVPEGSVEIS
ncbi:hypothetical protein ARAM_001444 [Aspergillus rambellii]|uniref:Phospholipase/carboxylesterase/thioesterase domain-containing protein n=1 Tax=Aspergillus rambellii TaxID=308745 RepID=A0A0F8XAX9_9EURO|nr:hypothetical protein ARAM_001444 [Aspergillus rambellii]